MTLLDSKTKTREKSNSLVLSRANFWIVPWNSVFSFLFFCLEPRVKKNTWMRTIFVKVMVITLKVPLWKLLDQLWSKFFLNNYEWHWQRYLKDTLQLKILQTCISIRPNSFLGKYHETNIGKGAWKIISCTKIWACSSKNISLITVFFFFPQGNLVLKFSLMLIK